MEPLKIASQSFRVKHKDAQSYLGADENGDKIYATSPDHACVLVGSQFSLCMVMMQWGLKMSDYEFEPVKICCNRTNMQGIITGYKESTNE